MELFGTVDTRGSAAKRVTPRPALGVGRVADRTALESDVPAEFVVGRNGRATG